MDKFDKFDNKLDKIDERLDGMSTTLVRNTESLEHHIARTNLLEDYVKKEIEPIKNHVQVVKHGFKAIMWMSVVLGGLAGFILTLKELGLF